VAPRTSPDARHLVALTVPDPLAARIGELRRHFARQSRFRIVPHLTLLPPVAVPGRPEGDALAQAVHEVAAETRPFTLTLAGVGYLPGFGYWAVTPEEPLFDIRHRLREAWRDFGQPDPTAGEPAYRPHVTLVKLGSGRQVDPELLAELADRVLGAGWWDVTSLDIHHLPPAGSRYLLAEQVPLEGAAWGAEAAAASRPQSTPMAIIAHNRSGSS